MLTYVHPQSGAETRGVRLGPGAIVSEVDVYDSTSGDWEPCSTPGCKLEPGFAAVFVRPTELGKEAKEFLVDMMAELFYLAHPTGQFWVGANWYRVSSPDWHPDSQVGLALRHQEIPPQLLQLGHIALLPESQTVYGLTDIGREVAQTLKSLQ